MAKLCPLFSSSSGNSTLISSGGQTILVDGGVSCKMLTLALGSMEINPKTISGIFITHEHIDHIRGLKEFTKQNATPVYATTSVLEFLAQNDYVHPSSQIIAVDSGEIILGEMKISAFNTPHDSVGSVGYRIHTSDGHRFAVATDIGMVTPIIEKNLSGCEVVVLESNYDDMMLKTGSYPYIVKQRIASSFGHLSNDCCANLVGRLIETGTTRFVLAHLSKENNLPNLAHCAVSSELLGRGFKTDVDYKLLVATPSFTGQVVYL